MCFTNIERFWRSRGSVVLLQRLMPNWAMQQSPDPATQPGYARTCISLQCFWWRMLCKIRVTYCAPHLRACMSSIMSLFYFGETDKNMTCTRTYATLRVFSKDMHPNDITEVLGVVPTGSRPIETNSKYKNRREFHLWKYTTEKLSDSVDNLKHLELILSALKGKEQQMRMLPVSYTHLTLPTKRIV